VLAFEGDEIKFVRFDTELKAFEYVELLWMINEEQSAVLSIPGVLFSCEEVFPHH
jgi:hypothetical protein